MKIRDNQAGTVHITAILLVIVLVAVGVVGWKVWDTRKHNNESTKRTADTTPVNSTNNAVTSIEITALGVKINDPDERGLQLHEEKICAAECDTENSYFIRDNNDDYFDRCNYPSGITKLDASSVDNVTQNPDSSLAKRTKKVGDSYYAATLGSNFQAPCDTIQDGDTAYEAALRQYILDNLEAL